MVSHGRKYIFPIEERRLKKSKSILGFDVFRRELKWCLFFLIISISCVNAQNAVWIIPQHPAALSSIESQLLEHGVKIRVKSEWLNCVSVEEKSGFNLNDFCEKNLCAVYPVLQLRSTSVKGVSTKRLDVSIEQMNGAAFIRKRLTGLGVKIGVTDAGYLYLNDSVRMSTLAHLLSANQIIETHDFVKNSDTISYYETYYTGRKSNYKERKNWLRRLRKEIKLIYHSHGTEVLKMIAGIDSGGENQIGLAPDASYYLARTEDGVKEFKEEEDYYIASLEWMYKQGVRIVNTSLGYGRGRKIKGSNYSPLEMNGSSMIAKAVQIACTQKNMLVVVAAGNDGDKRKWKVISTPADAEAALTVGSVLARFQRTSYSGVGPEFNTYLKPDVCSYSYQGTSLSAPAVCGFAACLLEENPLLTSTELKDLIVRSSHLYPYGNNFIGYGVPLANRALQLLENPDWKFNNALEVHVKGAELALDTIDVSIPTLTIFHKKNSVHVLKQEVIARDKKSNRFSIHPPKGIRRSTVQVGYFIYEVFWE
jgi:subtilisin